MIRVALCGAAGRMGREISSAVDAAAEMKLVLAIERPDHPELGAMINSVILQDDLRMHFTACDVIVDFTTPQGTVKHAGIAVEKATAFVTGTTGLEGTQIDALHEAAKSIPLLFASNMSMGMTVMGALTRTAARNLPGTYDTEIMEMHHRRKQDAPSGTALRLAGILREERSKLELRHGRSGRTGKRSGQELGVHALRGGDVVGEHHVIFAGPGERLILTHIADNRGAFVSGVLAALEFIVGQPAGFYGMEEVLGARPEDSP
ncbi:MAG: 4-hydroxy-tetrahydrodipicolinate reductase [Candidatus Eisenbacteria sp.]|nr:4-hydroxy-tetrahydrodipicolinate reductase [Candidatus Eisenbacteria bacterium]